MEALNWFLGGTNNQQLKDEMCHTGCVLIAAGAIVECGGTLINIAKNSDNQQTYNRISNSLGSIFVGTAVVGFGLVAFSLVIPKFTYVVSAD